MAESAAAGDPSQLYTAIEKAYCEDRWSDVLQQGEKLLARLPSDDLGLRQRLQLLMAHTFLYGFGDRGSAAELYRAVQASQAETALRQIAAQGLEQCEVPIQQAPEPEPSPQPPTGALPEPTEAAPLLEEGGPSLHEAALALSQEEATQPSEAPVMPWLESPATAAEPALIPEVIEEPELIEVHQADPILAEEMELKAPPPRRRTDAEEDEDLELRKGLLRVEIP
jgi:hypothetical protein